MIQDNLIEQLFHSLIAGDAKASRRIIEQTLADGVSIDELIIETYRPITTMVESLCRARQLTDRARDHATVLLQNLLDDARAGQIQPRSESCEIETVISSPRATKQMPYRTISKGLFSALTNRGASESSYPFVKLSYRNGVLRARLAGPGVGQREAQIIRQQVDDALDLVCHGLRSFVLDLSEVHSMSSFGLSACVELRNRAKSYGAKSILCGVSRRLVDLFLMLNVNRLYEEVLCETECAEAA